MLIMLATYSASRIIMTNVNKQQEVAQLSQRDRAAGWVSFGQK